MNHRCRQQPSQQEDPPSPSPIALPAITLPAAAVSAGLTGLASVAIRKQDKDLTLTSLATGNLTRRDAS